MQSRYLYKIDAADCCNGAEGMMGAGTPQWLPWRPGAHPPAGRRCSTWPSPHCNESPSRLSSFLCSFRWYFTITDLLIGRQRPTHKYDAADCAGCCTANCRLRLFQSSYQFVQSDHCSDELLPHGSQQPTHITPASLFRRAPPARSPTAASSPHHCSNGRGEETPESLPKH